MRRAIVALSAVHIKSVHFGPCRVVAGDVQRIKVVPIGINARPFGHGKAHLAQVMFTLNLLAFLLHTYLHLVDTTYKKIRAELGARRTFFEDIRALMRYMVFESWEALLYFMAVRLELKPAPD